MTKQDFDYKKSDQQSDNREDSDHPNSDSGSDVKTIRPEWDVPATVKVFSSTRIGGVSQAPFDSLNTGVSVKDNPQHVQQNRERLIKAVKAPNTPHWLDQVHGRDVAFIDCYHNQAQTIEADGAFTREPDQVLTVGSADCLPVVIANSQGSAVAVMHAGWRGLADGILQSGLAHFAEDDELHAWLGPAIGPEKFEVGTDVVEVFLAHDKQNASAFKPIGSNKFLADIYALARLTLKKHRRVHISGGEYCTYSQPDLFHSYRRDGAGSGRMATFAWIA